MNLELRNHVYHVTLLVPKDVREVIGKVRFRQSLGTSNKLDAELLGAPFIAKWKAMIRQARGQTNAVQLEAEKWKRELEKISDPEQELIFHEVLDAQTRAIEAAKGRDVAENFHGLATGSLTPINSHLEEWKEQITLAAKTKDQMIKDVELMVAKFPTVESVLTKGAVRRWVDELRNAGKGDSSISRILSFCRHYWQFMQEYGEVSKDDLPFSGVYKAANKKKAKKTTNFAYAPEDVVRLWKAARDRPMGQGADAPKDKQLADLILLGAYTGARIEELCSLRVENVTERAFNITDAKTQAGIREVPIHSALEPLVKQLKADSKDGFLISGLTLNKYDDRSNAIGKRFGRLKAALGFGETHTFHSFRSTVSTQLENAGVPEGVAADIVGHEKPTLTYGLYSHGSYLDTMKEAIEKVSYPFKSQTQE